VITRRPSRRLRQLSTDYLCTTALSQANRRHHDDCEIDKETVDTSRIAQHRSRRTDARTGSRCLGCEQFLPREEARERKTHQRDSQNDSQEIASSS